MRRITRAAAEAVLLTLALCAVILLVIHEIMPTLGLGKNPTRFTKGVRPCLNDSFSAFVSSRSVAVVR
jgi:hypothetical protein